MGCWGTGRLASKVSDDAGIDTLTQGAIWTRQRWLHA